VNLPYDEKTAADYHNLFEVVGFFLRNELTASV
jgi:hypothetical protein